VKTLPPLRRRIRLPRPDLNLPPALLAALIQLLAAIGAMAQSVWLARFAQIGMSVMQWAAVQGCIACLLAMYLGCAPWWRVMHLLFAPAVVVGLALQLPPAFSLVLLLILIGVYWTSYRSQVPLYLSGEPAWREVARLLPPLPGTRVIDLGSGLGGLVAYLARHCPGAKIEGIEAAPLPWLVSRVRQWLQGFDARIVWGDMWSLDLAGYDVVHAYLSPVPMPQLWEKACREMRAGGLLISHSFAVPGVAPTLVRQLPGQRSLYLYRVGG
jgi:hypothetical protein